MTLRVHFANITMRDLAKRIQKADLSATVVANVGAGAWGIEDGATATFAGLDTIREALVIAFVQSTIKALGEQAALIEREYNVSASLLWANGKRELIA